jgi:hypothetical protein
MPRERVDRVLEHYGFDIVAQLARELEARRIERTDDQGATPRERSP